ncbi:hypothetical protein WBG78_09285 [Chryseolinea sp. T2]|uniref:hypothetical protein n=1 Tax=Chryseolinea sp. T2 TaxID=3129255 RepID=UPI00307781D0
MLRLILLGASAATAAGLLFVNLYNSTVDAPNWGAHIPGSIEAARAYFSVANPGSFFRIASPVNQVLALLTVILCWKNNRYIALGALAFAVLADVMTFSYFYPRNEIMFIASIDHHAITSAWNEWSTMNWLRSGLCLANTVFAFALLTLNSKKTAQ